MSRRRSGRGPIQWLTGGGDSIDVMVTRFSDGVFIPVSYVAVWRIGVTATGIGVVP